MVEQCRGPHGAQLPPVAEEKRVDTPEYSFALVWPQLVSAWRSHGLLYEMLELRQKLRRNHTDFVYQDPTHAETSVVKHSGVAFPSTAAALGVSLLISERDVGPMVNCPAADVGRHRILYGQAYELCSTLPAQDVREELADPRDNLAFTCTWDSVNQIENWLARRARNHATPLLCHLLLHSLCDVLQHPQLFSRRAILSSVIVFIRH